MLPQKLFGTKDYVAPSMRPVFLVPLSLLSLVAETALLRVGIVLFMLPQQRRRVLRKA